MIYIFKTPEIKGLGHGYIKSASNPLTESYLNQVLKQVELASWDQNITISKHWIALRKEVFQTTENSGVRTGFEVVICIASSFSNKDSIINSLNERLNLFEKEILKEQSWVLDPSGYFAVSEKINDWENYECVSKLIHIAENDSIFAGDKKKIIGVFGLSLAISFSVLAVLYYTFRYKPSSLDEKHQDGGATVNLVATDSIKPVEPTNTSAIRFSSLDPDDLMFFGLNKDQVGPKELILVKKNIMEFKKAYLDLKNVMKELESKKVLPVYLQTFWQALKDWDKKDEGSSDAVEVYRMKKFYLELLPRFLKSIVSTKGIEERDKRALKKVNDSIKPNNNILDVETALDTSLEVIKAIIKEENKDIYFDLKENIENQRFFENGVINGNKLMFLLELPRSYAIDYINSVEVNDE